AGEVLLRSGQVVLLVGHAGQRAPHLGRLGVPLGQLLQLGQRSRLLVGLDQHERQAHPQIVLVAQGDGGLVLAGRVVNAVELLERAAQVAVAGERAGGELDHLAEAGGRVVPARLEHRGLAAQVVGQHVRRLLGDGLPAQLGGAGVVLLVHGLYGRAVEGERGILPDALRRRGADGGDGAEREADRGPVMAAWNPAAAQRVFSSKRTGKVTHTATASFPRRAGSKSQVRTASTAARSMSARPAELCTCTVPTFPLASTSNRRVTVPSTPSRRAASG